MVWVARRIHTLVVGFRFRSLDNCFQFYGSHPNYTPEPKKVGVYTKQISKAWQKGQVQTDTIWLERLCLRSVRLRVYSLYCIVKSSWWRALIACTSRESIKHYWLAISKKRCKWIYLTAISQGEHLCSVADTTDVKLAFSACYDKVFGCAV